MQNTETPSTPIREVAITQAGFEHLPLTTQSQASTATSVQAEWRIQGCGEPGELTSSAATVTPPALVCRTADLLSQNQMHEKLPGYDGQDESTEVVFNSLINEQVSKNGEMGFAARGSSKVVRRRQDSGQLCWKMETRISGREQPS